VSLLVPSRRVFRGWRKVLPLYDGRECPDCGAVTIGREGRELHRAYHARLGHWQDVTVDVLRALADRAGVKYVEDDAPERPGDGEYSRVSMRENDNYDDEEDDDDDE
jgi:hypothetical protein